MSLKLRHEQGNVYRVDISGTLEKADLEKCQEQVLNEIARVGPVRLLFVLDHFQGWERTDWRDFSFYVTHGDSIERIAIVGPERWQGETLMFAGADLRRAPVEFFAENRAAEARAWLSA